MRALLVEDDPMIGESVRTALRQDGFAVDWTREGKSANLALQTERYDIVLLDLGLPSRGGLEVLRAMRAGKDRTPVLIVTARDAVEERIRGLDAGADDYLVKPFDLDELAARIRSLLRRSVGRAEPVIEHLGRAAEDATLSGDPDALRVLMRNLADNAVRYTPPGGRVDVRVLRGEGKAVLEVADNGPGIPAADRERVFGRFYRGHGNDECGSGLGLAIVKAIATRHGARIELDDAPGGGLLARVVFPTQSPEKPLKNR